MFVVIILIIYRAYCDINIFVVQYRSSVLLISQQAKRLRSTIFTILVVVTAAAVIEWVTQWLWNKTALTVTVALWHWQLHCSYCISCCTTNTWFIRLYLSHIWVPYWRPTRLYIVSRIMRASEILPDSQHLQCRMQHTLYSCIVPSSQSWCNAMTTSARLRVACAQLFNPLAGFGCAAL